MSFFFHPLALRERGPGGEVKRYNSKQNNFISTSSFSPMKRGGVGEDTFRGTEFTKR